MKYEIISKENGYLETITDEYLEYKEYDDIEEYMEKEYFVQLEKKFDTMMVFKWRSFYYYVDLRNN